MRWISKATSVELLLQGFILTQSDIEVDVRVVYITFGFFY
jgi:hypothetical protein